ncbi:MarR family winged helix-turn-helix transcriptional regulator [Paenibacillus marinisediminis]
MLSTTDHPIPIDVIHVLIRSAHYIQREFDAQLSAFNMPYQITGPRLRLLSVVSESGKIRMNELAAKLGIKARTVTDFVDALERENLLVRIPDPTDRRATLIQLTELAETNLNQVLTYQAEIADKLLGNLSQDQRKQFLDLLLQLIANKDMSSTCDGQLK